MPYANNQGTNIHYHVEGDGPPLVLQHGFTSCLKSWYVHGYVEGLKENYRLILIDARGHGESDKPHDPNDYLLGLRVNDVLAVMDDLKIEKAHYLGYSMGGIIGFGIAQHAEDRFHSLIIGGMNPYASGAESVQARVDLLSQGIEAYVAHSESQGEPLEPDRRAWLLANDPQALIAAITAPRGLDDMAEVLPKMTMPCLLYCGDADGFYPGVKECMPHLPNATLATLPGLDHVQTSQASRQVLPHVQKFLKGAVLQASATR